MGFWNYNFTEIDRRGRRAYAAPLTGELQTAARNREALYCLKYVYTFNKIKIKDI